MQNILSIVLIGFISAGDLLLGGWLIKNDVSANIYSAIGFLGLMTTAVMLQQHRRLVGLERKIDELTK